MRICDVCTVKVKDGPLRTPKSGKLTKRGKVVQMVKDSLVGIVGEENSTSRISKRGGKQ